ncbi:hypothetical protein GCM10010425_74380 [Streptomyces spororaveus]|uniref:Lsr2 protein n=1 Tax=Streptomyces spororaveus TaxID=284039 RepID=A0ABQ3T247_9ACTN|nr:hypothetical protein Sspor_00250 [Streptomyces spororaveus]
MTRIDDTPPAWDERTQLTTFLDYTRDTVRAKCEGVSAEDARKAVPKKRASTGRPLMELTKAELYKKATAAGIEGRSTMTHDQLAEALTHSGSSRYRP